MTCPLFFLCVCVDDKLVQLPFLVSFFSSSEQPCTPEFLKQEVVCYKCKCRIEGDSAEVEVEQCIVSSNCFLGTANEYASQDSGVSSEVDDEKLL